MMIMVRFEPTGPVRMLCLLTKFLPTRRIHPQGLDPARSQNCRDRNSFPGGGKAAVPRLRKQNAPLGAGKKKYSQGPA